MRKWPKTTSALRVICKTGNSLLTGHAWRTTEQASQKKASEEEMEDHYFIFTLRIVYYNQTVFQFGVMASPQNKGV